jgi:GntR family phosphonate transport system transcriptional regulator
MTFTSISSLKSVASERESFWEQIATEITAAISNGTYLPGQRLPTEHSLANQFGVNRHTIRRSLSNLCSQGLLRVIQGSGTYVEEFAVDLLLTKRTRLHQSLEQAGLKGGLQVLKSQTVVASTDLAHKLKVPVRTKLLLMQTIGEASNFPLSVSERYFPLPRFSGLEASVLQTGSITAAFSACGVADYTRLTSRITADMPKVELAGLLKQPATRPVLLVESVNIDAQGVPIEFATTWFAGDRVSLTVNTHE